MPNDKNNQQQTNKTAYTLFFYKNQQNFAEAQLFLILRLIEARFVLKLFLILVEAQSFSVLEHSRKELCS